MKISSLHKIKMKNQIQTSQSEGEYLKEFWRTYKIRNERWIDRNIRKLPREQWNSQDKILANYKFTNSYRELDRNSQWEIRNIICNPLIEDMRQMLFQIVYFRFFNNPEHFEWMKEDCNHSKWFTETKNGVPSIHLFSSESDIKEFSEFLYQKLALIRKDDINPFTNAYLTNSQGYPGKTRDWAFSFGVIPKLIQGFHSIHTAKNEWADMSWLWNGIKLAENAERVIYMLEQLPSVAHFLSHEFFVSFCYIQKYRGQGFVKDVFEFTEMDYTNVGPGALVGLQNIFIGDTTNMSCPEYKRFCREDLDKAPTKIGIYYILEDCRLNPEKYDMQDFNFIHWNQIEKKYEIRKGIENWNLTLHNVEFWLCEYQKYRKMVTGEGKQRSKWVPRPDIF